jgi:hypothetical protein
MKSPPVQYPDAVARELTEAFIRGEDVPAHPVAEVAESAEAGAS